MGTRKLEILSGDKVQRLKDIKYLNQIPSSLPYFLLDETHKNIASHYHIENQGLNSSRVLDATQMNGASRNADEPRKNIASRNVTEPQHKCASQEHDEPQSNNASQRRFEPHRRDASQSAYETQHTVASPRSNGPH